jgi:DNA-directed RNA polymerase subunit RPC12/RpoP
MAEAGYRVVAMDRQKQIGGSVNNLVPDFRYDKAELTRLQERLIDLGVELRQGVDVGESVKLKDLIPQFDSVFIGHGLDSPQLVPVATEGVEPYYAVDLLDKHRYTPEQLKQMTPEEVNDHIRADIWEDAFERQAIKPIEFKGKNLAEGLEKAFYFCPKCGKTGTLHSEGDVFSCTCGMRVRYNTLGFFEKVEPDDPEPIFTTTRDWDFWQNGRILEYADSLADDEIAYSDEDGMLIAVGAKHKDSVAEIGKLSISKKELSVGSHHFPLDRVSSMGLVGVYKMLVSMDGKSYELRAAKTPYCGRKYFTFYELLKNRQDS